MDGKVQLALRVNIGASDAEVTPPMFGDLIYNNDDTVSGIPLKGMSLREIASLTDNLLTYWKKYPPFQWFKMDSILRRINYAFVSPLRYVSKTPLVFTGDVYIDSVTFLKPSEIPIVRSLVFPPNSLEETSPLEFKLFQNYPNPFNPSTVIEFTLPKSGLADLKVYDILGREIVTLLDEVELDEGQHEVEFDGSDMASGVYFYRIVVNKGEFLQVRKMILVR